MTFENSDENRQRQAFQIEPSLITVAADAVGSGEGSVYCYYFRYVRRAREQAGKRSWPCKIGMTERSDVRERVAEQFRQTGLFEAPVVGFLARSDAPRDLEARMQARFPTRRRMKGGKGLGTEWVEANLGEVRRAYREAAYPKWHHWPLRIALALRMKIAARGGAR